MQLNLKILINRNIRNLIITFIILILATVLYYFAEQISIMNVFFAPFMLDSKSAFISDNLISISGKNGVYSPAQTINNTEALFYNKYMKLYKQDKKYIFKIKAVDVIDLGLYYETTYGISMMGINSRQSDPIVTEKYLLINTGEAYIVAKVDPDLKIKQNQTYKGTFSILSSSLLNDVSNALGASYVVKDVFKYEFDTLTKYYQIEYPYIINISVLAFFDLYILVKLILYFISYHNHPTYRQLKKLYGNINDNEFSIDAELSDNKNLLVSGKYYITPNWKIKTRLYKTKISRIKTETAESKKGKRYDV